MRATIQFDMDNAAFGNTGEEKAFEFNRILNQISRKLSSISITDGEEFPIMDFNGDKVGAVRINP